MEKAQLKPSFSFYAPNFKALPQVFALDGHFNQTKQFRVQSAGPRIFQKAQSCPARRVLTSEMFRGPMREHCWERGTPRTVRTETREWTAAL